MEYVSLYIMTNTYKQRYNKKFGNALNKSNTLREIAKNTGFKLSGLQTIYNKGIGAWKTNPSSVRRKDDITKRGGPRSKLLGKEQWAMSRVYSAVMGGKASKTDASHLLKKTS